MTNGLPRQLLQAEDDSDALRREVAELRGKLERTESSRESWRAKANRYAADLTRAEAERDAALGKLAALCDAGGTLDFAFIATMIGDWSQLHETFPRVDWQRLAVFFRQYGEALAAAQADDGGTEE